MTYDEAIENAARTLKAAEDANDVERTRELINAANTWVRIADSITVTAHTHQQ